MKRGVSIQDFVGTGVHRPTQFSRGCLPLSQPHTYVTLKWFSLPLPRHLFTVQNVSLLYLNYVWSLISHFIALFLLHSGILESYLILVLLSELKTSSSPDEFTAVGTEGGLSQKCGHELVTVDLVNSAAHGTTPPVEPLAFLEFPWLGLLIFCKYKYDDLLLLLI